METQKTSPLVSVIMPAYNAESYIKEAIHSVLTQTVTDLELIVIDDGSKDRTYEIAKEQEKADNRVSVIHNASNVGVARSRNAGIELAKGEYIAFLDSDDIWYPEKLRKQIDKITANHAQVCYCSYAIVDAAGCRVKRDYLVPESVGFEDLLKENCMQCSAMMIRTEVVKRIMFNTQYYHEDYILGLDMLRDGSVAVGCSEVLLAWRYIQNSRSFNKIRSAQNRWRIYRHYLKLPVEKCLWAFFNYACAGLRKYAHKRF